MKTSPLKAVTTFTLGYLAVAFLLSFRAGNGEFLYYIAIVLALAFIVLAVHKRVNLSPALLWCLSAWGFFHMLGGLLPVPESWPINGDVRVLYSLWFIPGYLKYDHIIHAYGFAIATWVCWQALRAACPSVKATFGVLSLCALGGLGLGGVNEILEFFAVLLIPNTNVGGYINTGWDLVSNAVGCIVAASLIRKYG